MTKNFALHLVVNDPDEAAEWYASALGAEETGRLTLPTGQTLTVDLRIGDLDLAIAGEMPAANLKTPATLGATPAAFHLPVSDVDSAFRRAVDAGATVFSPVKDAFWGDRTGQILDPSGHRWALNQHLRDVPREELQALAAQAFS